eukprot:1148881-Pelagomonas_calceolata.AAC.2
MVACIKYDDMHGMHTIKETPFYHASFRVWAHPRPLAGALDEWHCFAASVLVLFMTGVCFFGSPFVGALNDWHAFVFERLAGCYGWLHCHTCKLHQCMRKTFFTPLLWRGCMSSSVSKCVIFKVRRKRAGLVNPGFTACSQVSRAMCRNEEIMPQKNLRKLSMQNS